MSSSAKIFVLALLLFFCVILCAVVGLGAYWLLSVDDGGETTGDNGTGDQVEQREDPADDPTSTDFDIDGADITAEEAVEIVEALPEVKEWLGYFTNPDGTSPTTDGRSVVEVDLVEDDKYVVHVYEVLPDHTATFGWYMVDSETGEVGVWF